MAAPFVALTPDDFPPIDRTLTGRRATADFWGGITGTVQLTFPAGGGSTSIRVDVDPGTTSPDGRPVTTIESSIARWTIHQETSNG